MPNESLPPAAGEPESINIPSLSSRPPRFQERPWLPGSHPEAMRAGLAVTAVLTAVAVLAYGGVGAAIGNDAIVHYAESSLGSLWKLWAIVFLFYFVGPVRAAQQLIAAARDGWSRVRGEGQRGRRSSARRRL